MLTCTRLTHTDPYLHEILLAAASLAALAHPPRITGRNRRAQPPRPSRRRAACSWTATRAGRRQPSGTSARSPARAPPAHWTLASAAAARRRPRRAAGAPPRCRGRALRARGAPATRTWTLRARKSRLSGKRHARKRCVARKRAAQEPRRGLARTRELSFTLELSGMHKLRLGGDELRRQARQVGENLITSWRAQADRVYA
jgi:hypothetical protein